MGESTPVRVTDIEMTMWSMMIFMVKWAIASIPAIMIIGAIMTIFSMVGIVVLMALGVAIAQ